MNIVHRDLKPENLLLDDHRNIKIVDFGLSNVYRDGQLLKTACGSPCYAAPEMIAGHNYVPSLCDLWSCGVILFALVCGYLPFEDQNTASLYKKILNADYRAPKFISDAVKNLISGLLTTEPSQRFTVQVIRSHPWYRQISEASVPPSDLMPGQHGMLEEDVLRDLDSFGFPRDYAVRCLELNKHNHVTTTYYLLAEKKRRMLDRLDRIMPAEAHGFSMDVMRRNTQSTADDARMEDVSQPAETQHATHSAVHTPRDVPPSSVSTPRRDEPATDTPRTTYDDPHAVTRPPQSPNSARDNRDAYVAMATRTSGITGVVPDVGSIFGAPRSPGYPQVNSASPWTPRDTGNDSEHHRYPSAQSNHAQHSSPPTPPSQSTRSPVPGLNLPGHSVGQADTPRRRTPPATSYPGVSPGTRPVSTGADSALEQFYGQTGRADPLQASTDRDHAMHEDRPNSLPKCPYCGTVYQITAKYCLKCGADRISVQVPSSSTMPAGSVSGVPSGVRTPPGPLSGQTAPGPTGPHSSGAPTAGTQASGAHATGPQAGTSNPYARAGATSPASMTQRLAGNKDPATTNTAAGPGAAGSVSKRPSATAASGSGSLSTRPTYGGNDRYNVRPSSTTPRDLTKPTEASRRRTGLPMEAPQSARARLGGRPPVPNNSPNTPRSSGVPSGSLSARGERSSSTSTRPMSMAGAGAASHGAAAATTHAAPLSARGPGGPTTMGTTMAPAPQAGGTTASRLAWNAWAPSTARATRLATR